MKNGKKNIEEYDITWRGFMLGELWYLSVLLLVFGFN
jgi:hypothetical protein